jgi:hypothetical protein
VAFKGLPHAAIAKHASVPSNIFPVSRTSNSCIIRRRYFKCAAQKIVEVVLKFGEGFVRKEVTVVMELLLSVHHQRMRKISELHGEESFLRSQQATQPAKKFLARRFNHPMQKSPPVSNHNA